jgi:S-layer homology domain
MTRFLCAWFVAMFCAALAGADEGRPVKPLLTKRIDPKEFGVQDDTITVVSATSFAPQKSLIGTAYSPTFGLSCDPNNDMHYYAALDLPAGAVIDTIGLNSLTDTDGILGLALWLRNADGALVLLASFSVPAHGWGTDYDGPLDITVSNHENNELVIDVENAASPTLEFFSWVEVWWHRTVSPPPGSPTFNDVPVSDPAFQYIEALAASGVTSGCGGGNYCPDAALTRRQMAVFLSKALGLHWPL